MYIGEKLKSLRDLKRMTAKEVSDELSISNSSYNKYEYNQRKPSTDIVVELAKYFCVSTDYLLGLSDNPNPESKVIKDNHGNNNNVAFGINATELPVTIVPADNNLGENERELLKRFDSLDYEQKIEIMQMIIEKSKKKSIE